MNNDNNILKLHELNAEKMSCNNVNNNNVIKIYRSAGGALSTINADEAPEKLI